MNSFTQAGAVTQNVQPWHLLAHPCRYCGASAGSRCRHTGNNILRPLMNTNSAQWSSWPPEHRCASMTAVAGMLMSCGHCGRHVRLVNDVSCHCGRPVAYGYDGDPNHHRGMCADCDAMRCDANPMECPHREGRR